MASPIDPVAAAMDAIAKYFDGAIDGVTVKSGWPDGARALDLSKGPKASVTPGPPRSALVSPKVIGEADEPGKKLVRVAEFEVLAQLDLWAPQRAVRDRLALRFEEAFHNGLPFRTGLWLTSTDYRDRPLIIEAQPARNTDDRGTSAADGIWRQTWDLAIRSDLVVAVEMVELAIVTLQAEVELAGLVLTEADIDVDVET